MTRLKTILAFTAGLSGAFAIPLLLALGVQLRLAAVFSITAGSIGGFLIGWLLRSANPYVDELTKITRQVERLREAKKVHEQSQRRPHLRRHAA